jgi:hypothetical protein
MKVYISGDTSGPPQTKFKFKDAEAYLKNNNHIPINPLKIDPSNRIEVLANCDAIFLLADWAQSQESIMEKHIADTTGKKILFDSLVEENKNLKG